MRWAEADRLRELGKQNGNRKKNEEPPAWKKNEPPRIEAHAFYMDAFRVLSTERALGPVGSGRIPFSRIVWFGQRMHLAPDVIDVLAAVIVEMDIAFMAWQHEQIAQAEEDAKAAANTPPRDRGRRGR